VIESAPSIQQILESGVGASSAEYSPNFIDVVRQELAGEVQHERLAYTGPERELARRKSHPGAFEAGWPFR
jgi:hypothetical protein